MRKINLKTYTLRKPKKSDVAEIVDAYCKAKGIDQVIKFSNELKQKYPYCRMCGRARRLLDECGGNISDALWAIQFGGYWL